MFVAVAALALLPLSGVSDDEYEFVPENDRRVTVWRNDPGQHAYWFFGRLDAAGSFIPDTKYVLRSSGNRPRGPLINVGTNAVYEYRSGLLIPGRLERSHFAPEAGSRVIALRDYLKDCRPAGSLPIYNLPGTIRPKAPPGPGGAAPPLATAPTAPAVGGTQVQAGDYQYVREPGRMVELRRRDGGREYWSIGTLDADGDFVPDEEFLNKMGPKPAGTPAATLLNRDGMGEVFEFRSGRLIKGKIDDKLNFVPEVGSTVIDLKSYRYGPGALPIWNLPGYFQKK